ncbi:MAG TPA: TetR/AcrR family transcriptional regulator C-terminal domain-containing protein [Ramlibacter sp.]|nr:TetR/AcrR family transcriptional regulator C-terminal domain-containing protein [Ramlibacter sp.]
MKAAAPKKRTAVKTGSAVVARGSLTTDVIVAAAIKALQKDGLAGVSMRQLASVLEVTPTAIYHHVKDKDELLDLCAVEILRQIPTPDPGLPWTKRMRFLILEQQRVFMRVPGLAKYLLVHRQSSVAALQWAEAVLSVMHDAGFKAPQTLTVLMSMSFLVNPITLIDDKVPAKAFTPVLYRTRASATIKKHPGMFPCVTEVLPHLQTSSYEAQFETALDRVIAGIERELTGHAA